MSDSGYFSHNQDATSSNEYTLVPYTALSQDALDGVMENFISREGTDYGEFEVDLDDKKRQVLAQLKSGVAVILFDHDSQSVTIVHKDQLV